MSVGTRLLSPEEIAVRAGEQVTLLRLPEPGLFAERELRLRQLAAGHAMRDYLLFCAELARGQHELLQVPATPALPTPAQIEAAANAGRPLLDAQRWPRDPAWRGDLRALLQGLAARVPPGPARDTALRLAAVFDEHLELQAERLLSGVMLGLDLGTAPLIGAALQLHWARLIAGVQARHGTDPLAPFGRIDDPLVCPCCGSRPSASITRIGAEGSGFRYLACSLCATQWHYVRIKCAHCQGTKGISFQALQALDGQGQADEAAVQVECCETCGHYLKIVHMEKDHQVEPLADDLASLTLDLLVAETGLQRHGVNLLLLFGDPDAAAPPDPGGGR
ncbi:formate dehydrogenase accessory protein FdhE [Roseateles sp. DAIF2]|uniref:formate dehydrogenase accessory protein FdhE n=1 Tax=Roseateles sp. DAIF2 TaxID=2714952 RepID=UPI0018A321EC|nr:formate dehydrogenase accessory protein FdhE [Roseateles sp. DAIF2]QPF74793.1 formate dehydrogenase accessory protein FdhE [Roseateles sp. DAIF2]